MEPLEHKLVEGVAELKTLIAKRDEEIKNLGTSLSETKTALVAQGTQLLAQQTQLDAVDAKTQQRHIAEAEEQKSLGDMITGSDAFKEAAAAGFMGRKSINVELKTSAFPRERKATVTTGAIGGATTGVIQITRLPGLVPMPQIALRIRDVMNVVNLATGNAFDYVYQSTRTNAPSPQVETSPKSQSFYDWKSAVGYIRTIAHFVQVSKQALADVSFVRDQIDTELVYGLKVKEEQEILSGDGTGQHLQGIIPVATAFDTAYNVAAAGWQRLDQLRWAKLQARLAGLATYAPNAFVLHPTDLAHLEVTKDNYGHYIIGDPKTGPPIPMVWGIPVVESDSITAGTFLVGSFNFGATLVDRQQVSTEISFEHGTNFTSNEATVLCEERIGLAIKKASAFITGSFSTSPATQN